MSQDKFGRLFTINTIKNCKIKTEMKDIESIHRLEYLLKSNLNNDKIIIILGYRLDCLASGWFCIKYQELISQYKHFKYIYFYRINLSKVTEIPKSLFRYSPQIIC